MASKSINLKMDLDIRDYIKKLETMDKTQARALAKGFAEQQKTNRKVLDLRIQAEKNAARKSAEAWDSIYGKAMAGISMAAIAGVAREIGSLGQEVADMRNQLADTATRTGLSVEVLGALQHAAKGAGLEFSSLDSSLAGFPKRMMDFARDTGEAKVAFEQLDIQVTNLDGTMRESDVVFRETISKLQAMESPTERAALATQLFGESGTRLIQSLGTADLEAWIDQNERFGLDVGPAALDSAARYQRAVAELSASMRKMKGAAVDAFDFTSILEGWSTLIVFSVEVAKQASQEIIDTFKHMMNATAKLGEMTVGIGRIYVENWTKGRAAILDAVAAYVEAENSTNGLREETDRLGGSLDRIIEAGAAAVREQNRLRAATQGVTEAEAAGVTAKGKYTKATKDETDALQDYNKALEQVISSQVKFLSPAEDRERRADELKTWLERQQEIESEAAETKAQKQAEAIAAQQRMQADYQAFMASSFQAILDASSQAQEAELSGIQETLAEQLSERERLYEELASMESDHERGRQMLRIADLNADIAANEEKKAEAKRLLVAQYRAQQAAALVEIGINTAAAIMKGYAMFGPPPSPLGIAAAVSAGVAGAVQASVVALQKPPEFHTGGIIQGGSLQPDERLVVARTGEAVLNQRAVDNLGTEGVDALNEGSGSRGPTVQQIVFEGRVLDTMVSRVIDAGGRVSQRINAGRQPPGISLVYGV